MAEDTTTGASSVAERTGQSQPMRLTDLEWTFGVSASSSEHAAIGATFVQLRMKTQEQNTHVEMNLAEFYDFMHELESAKAQMEVI